MKSIIILFLFLALLIAPVSAGNFSINVSPVTYLNEDSAVPFMLWCIMVIIGVALLIVGIFVTAQAPIVCIMSMLFLTMAAFSAPVAADIGHSTFTTNDTAGNTVVHVVPISQTVLQPWSMWALWGLSLIAFLGIWRGVLLYFRDVPRFADAEEWDEWM